MSKSDWGQAIALNELKPGQSAIVPNKSTLWLDLVICVSTAVRAHGLHIGDPLLLCQAYGEKVKRFELIEPNEVKGVPAWLLPQDWRVRPFLDSIERLSLREEEHLQSSLFLCEQGKLYLPGFHKDKVHGFVSWIPLEGLTAFEDVDPDKYGWMSFTHWEVLIGAQSHPEKIWSNLR